MFNAQPFYANPAGLSTPFGTLLSPGMRVVAYVGSNTAAFDQMPRELVRKRVSTLAAALDKVSANQGDVIVVLPGHTENVSDATMLDKLKAGTTILGMGNVMSDDAPTFTFNASTAKWTIDQADITIQNLRFNCIGADSVDECFEVTATRATFIGNYFTVEDTTNQADIIINLQTGASYCSVISNTFRGEGSASSNCVCVSHTNSVDGNTIQGNTMIGAFHDTRGAIRLASASKDILVADNIIDNSNTGSTACIAVENASSDGIVVRNLMGVRGSGTASALGILVTGTSSALRFCENYCTDEARASGILSPAAAT